MTLWHWRPSIWTYKALWCVSSMQCFSCRQLTRVTAHFVLCTITLAKELFLVLIRSFCTMSQHARDIPLCEVDSRVFFICFFGERSCHSLWSMFHELEMTWFESKVSFPKFACDSAVLVEHCNATCQIFVAHNLMIRRLGLVSRLAALLLKWSCFPVTSNKNRIISLNCGWHDFKKNVEQF